MPIIFREANYLEGGIQFVTSRILMVDFLSERIPVNNVAGIVVLHAEEWALEFLAYKLITKLQKLF